MCSGWSARQRSPVEGETGEVEAQSVYDLQRPHRTLVYGNQGVNWSFPGLDETADTASNEVAGALIDNV